MAVHMSGDIAHRKHCFSSCEGLGPDFVSLYRSQSRTDVTLIVQSREFKVHRIILSTRSKYFADLFNAYPCRSTIEVNEAFDLDTFDRILEYIYGGKLDINGAADIRDLIKMERLAHKMNLDLGKVFQAKKRWLENADQPFLYHQNVFNGLKRAFVLKNEQGIAKCFTLIIDKFNNLYGHPEMLRLPFPILLAFVSRADRRPLLDDAITLFLFCWYATQKEEGVEEFILTRQMRKLFKHIKLEYVDTKRKIEVLRPKDWVSAEDLWQSRDR
jgi:hypothetical protein